jgi:hypothetical protein
MNTITYITTLLFFDYPQIFLGRDSVGTYYVCMMVEEYEDKPPTYYATVISIERYKRLIQGLEDLKNIYLNPEMKKYFLVNYHSENVFLLTDSSFIADYLPDEGLVLDMPDDDVLLEAKNQRSPVAIIQLKPDEAKDHARIHTGRLAQFLDIFERNMRQLGRYTLKKGGENNFYTEDEASFTDVYGFSYGSFTVKLRSTLPSDMLNDSPRVSSMFALFNEFLVLSNNPDKLVAAFKERNFVGHAANTWLKLLEFIANDQCPFIYHWATPVNHQSYSSSITVDSALSAINHIKASDITTTNVVLEGRVEAVTLSSNRWSLRAEDNKLYKGHTREGLTLSGIVINTKRYKFKCIETLKVDGFGKELPTYEIQEIISLD